MDAAALESRDDPGNQDEHERSWRAASGLIGVLAALVVGLWLLSLTSDDGNDIDGRDADPVDEDSFEAPTTTAVLREPEASTEVVSEDGEPGDAAPAEPFSELEGQLIYLSGRQVAWVDLAAGTVQRVPIEPAGSPSCPRTSWLSWPESPSHRTVAGCSTTPARAWLFDRQTGQLRLLDGGGYGRPLWSDDSGSVAWLTSDRTPTLLVVARLEPSDAGQDWFAVELAGLGIDPSPGSSFLLDATVSPISAQ